MLKLRKRFSLDDSSYIEESAILLYYGIIHWGFFSENNKGVVPILWEKTSDVLDFLEYLSFTYKIQAYASLSLKDFEEEWTKGFYQDGKESSIEVFFRDNNSLQVVGPDKLSVIKDIFLRADREFEGVNISFGEVRLLRDVYIRLSEMIVQDPPLNFLQLQIFNILSHFYFLVRVNSDALDIVSADFAGYLLKYMNDELSLKGKEKIQISGIDYHLNCNILRWAKQRDSLLSSMSYSRDLYGNYFTLKNEVDSMISLPIAQQNGGVIFRKQRQDLIQEMLKERSFLFLHTLFSLSSIGIFRVEKIDLIDSTNISMMWSGLEGEAFEYVANISILPNDAGFSGSRNKLNLASDNNKVVQAEDRISVEYIYPNLLKTNHKKFKMKRGGKYLYPFLEYIFKSSDEIILVDDLCEWFKCEYMSDDNKRKSMVTQVDRLVEKFNSYLNTELGISETLEHATGSIIVSKSLRKAMKFTYPDKE